MRLRDVKPAENFSGFRNFADPLAAPMTPEKITAVIAEARSWIHTPYHHHARVKGAGVDCAMLLIEVFSRAGAIPDFDPGFYTADWFLHREDEQYISWLAKYADKVERGAPGDVALYRFGRTASHGGIIVEAGVIVHAYRAAGCVEAREMLFLANRLDSFWRVR